MTNSIQKITGTDCQISRFVERDIDIFLAEELRVNPGFSRWFLAHGEQNFICEHPAIWTDVSVVEDGSEADVSALFADVEGNKFRLYVENKITAGKMPEQLERYVRRARNEMARGETSGWAVKLFAPNGYWARSCPEGVQLVTFEQAGAFIAESSEGPRDDYRANFLLSAAAAIRGQNGRDKHNALTQPFIKEWWDAVYDSLEDRFPNYFLHKTKYPASVYFAPETHCFPRHLLRVDFKGHKGEVDLAFKTSNPKALAAALKAIPDCPGQVVINPKSASIRISGLPKFVISDGLVVIETHVMQSYDAAHRLIEFWKKYDGELISSF